jgi:hypothetical protein
MEEKLKVIENIVNKSLDDNNFANPARMRIHLVLEIMYAYTNINFTEKQKEDEHKLYDSLKSNGLIDAFIEQMNDFDYSELFNMLDDTKKELTEYKRSAAGIVQNLITDLPKQAEAMKAIMDTFDPNKYQEVVNFAKAANGGREIE